MSPPLQPFPLLSGSIDWLCRRLLEIRPEDIFIQAQHQTAAARAEGRMVVQSGDPRLPAMAIQTLVFIKRHTFYLLLGLLQLIFN